PVSPKIVPPGTSQFNSAQRVEIRGTIPWSTSNRNDSGFFNNPTRQRCQVAPTTRAMSGSSQSKIRTFPLLVPSSSEVTSVEDASPTIGTNLPGSSSLGGT